MWLIPIFQLLEGEALCLITSAKDSSKRAYDKRGTKMKKRKREDESKAKEKQKTKNKKVLFAFSARAGND
jgi:hypothetical protein